MNLQEMIHCISSRSGYRSDRRYIAKCEFLYHDIALPGKRVLEIGCGKGAFALWAALRGAEFVLGIEPEHDGSTPGVLSHFKETISELGLKNIKASPLAFENLPSDTYNVILLYNVINHFNEKAVAELHQNKIAFDTYLEISRKLFDLLSPDGLLILTDCSRSNAWNSLKLRSPFALSIEWCKHQNPQTWQVLFSQAGFQCKDLRWSPLYPFGWITSNYIMQYLTISHFVLRFVKPHESC